jgi:hypothetical protein
MFFLDYRFILFSLKFRLSDLPKYSLFPWGGSSVTFYIQGVSEIGALILTGNRTRQKE